MKCPKCGYELVEGHLYCDNCGEEIRIVPDYEPEIEREINESLATLLVELADEEMPALADGAGPETETGIAAEKGKGKAAGGNTGKTGGVHDKDGKKEKRGKRKKRVWIIAVVCLFLVLAAAAGSWAHYRYLRIYSVDYQMEEAHKAAEMGMYAKAVEWLEKARGLDPDNITIFFRLAELYGLQGKEDTVLSMMQEVIQDPERFGETEEERAYAKAIEIYKGREDYPAIIELLEGCGREDIVNGYQQFIAKPPEFSEEGGRYQEVLPLKLSANTSGKIYYTLDGTKPNKKSSVYTAPIFLEPGSYIVTAYFVNDYGIESDAVSNTYHIEVQPPPAPEVSAYSGEYREPCMIEVTVPEDCLVYYTSDGSVPTIDSSRYTTAISMPLGDSVYQFIAVSPEGAVSEMTVCEYHLELHTDVTVDMAISNVIHALMRADVLLDENGKMRGMSGRNVYKYNAVVRIEGCGDYYVIYEYYEDATGIQSKTERMYGVNIENGMPCRITYDAEGKIVLVDI